MQSFHDRETNCEESLYYIFERSLFSSLYIFADLNCNKLEMENLVEKSKTMGRPYVFPNTKVIYIYLRTPFRKCFENIQKRQKPTDHLITLEYLETLEKKHDSVFLDKWDCETIESDDYEESFEMVKNFIMEYKIDIKMYQRAFGIE